MAKVLIGDDTVDETLLTIYYGIIEQRVKNYCHISEIPPDLEVIIAQMVADYWKYKTREMENSQTSTQTGAKRVTRGDTTIEFGAVSTSGAQSPSEKTISDFVADYYHQLYVFRRVVTI